MQKGPLPTEEFKTLTSCAGSPVAPLTVRAPRYPELHGIPNATVSRTPRSRIRGAERTACPSGLTVAVSSARLAGPRSAASTAARPPTCFRKCSSICGARCDRGANRVSLDTTDRRAACDVRHARCGMRRTACSVRCTACNTASKPVRASCLDSAASALKQQKQRLQWYAAWRCMRHVL